jgi:pimeloyl-ACP methyl ester carboxylesterase
VTVHSSEFTRVNGPLAYMWNGVVEGTPVVFLHGFGDMGECWNALVDRLELDVPVYLVDAPAHGYSAFDPERDFTEQLVARTIEFISSLGRPVVLVGHSMGALQSMYISGDVPELVKAIVLEDPPMAADLSPWRESTLIEGLFGFLVDVRNQDAASAQAQLLASHPHWPTAELEPWVRSKQLVDPSMAERFVIHREPMETTLARVTCPALLLTGDPAAGAIITPATVAWARPLCPSLEVAHFAGSGHNIRRNAPDAVASLMRSFLEPHL